MDTPRLIVLLQQCETRELSTDEEQELSRLLADPGCRAIAEQRLGPLRERFTAAQEYDEALVRPGPPLPAARLAQLQKQIRSEPTPAGRRNVIAFPRWAMSLGAVGLAACLVFMVWPQMVRPTNEAALSLEYGMVSSAGPLRANSAGTDDTSAVPGWQITTRPTRADLEAWTKATLPAGVQARVWIDEEAGVFRVIHRRQDGSLVTFERPVDAATSIQDQLAALERVLRSP